MREELPSAANGPEGADSGTERLLIFRLDDARFAFALTDVAGLAPYGRIRQVPLAPPAVVGLAEWRGNPLTVLDLRKLLGFPELPETSCLVRLAPPLHRTAFRVPATVTLAPPQPPSEATTGDGRVLVDGRLFRLLDPAVLVSRVEGQMKAT